jgi:hypothetical protein
MEDFSDSATCIGEPRDGQYVSNDSAAGELRVSDLESSLNVDAAELYGSPTQFEQYQITTTAINFDQTVPGPEASYNVYPTYVDQQSQVLETQTSVSITEYATYSTGQTYDASQTMVYAIPQEVSCQDNVASGLIQSYQAVDTAYTNPAAVDGPASQAAQGIAGQADYMVQPAQSYHLDASTVAVQPDQTPTFTQPQVHTQGGYTATGYQHILQVGPDGQQYYVQVPVPVQQPGIYHVNPNSMQAQPLTLQLQFTKPKILRRETASQAKEATIKFSKQAYAKSKEFITNKDGARAVAKQTWKQSKNLTIKTTDMLDKYVKPLMPFIAMQDMELATALRVAQGVGHSLKGPGGGVQRRPVGSGGQAVQQMDAAALANLAQVLSLLQGSGGNAGVMGGGGGGQMDEGQVRLLAALLQVQQQQTGQAQVYQQQQQGPNWNDQTQGRGQSQQTSQSQVLQQQTQGNTLAHLGQQTMHPQMQPPVQQQQPTSGPQQSQQQQQLTSQPLVQQQVQPSQPQQHQIWSQELHPMQPTTSCSQIQQHHQSPSAGNREPPDHGLTQQLYQQQPASFPSQPSSPVQQHQPVYHRIHQPAVQQQQQQQTALASQTRPKRKPVGSGSVSTGPGISTPQSPPAQAQPVSPPPVLDQNIHSPPLNNLEPTMANLSIHTLSQVAAPQQLAQQPLPAS